MSVDAEQARKPDEKTTEVFAHSKKASNNLSPQDPREGLHGLKVSRALASFLAPAPAPVPRNR